MGKAKKIGIGIIISVVGFFAIGLVGVTLWEQYFPEDYAAFQEEQKQRELQEQAEATKTPTGLSVILESYERQEAAQIKESKLVELTDRQVADLVKQYKGKDGKGDRLVDVLATLITIAYPNEQILDNPSSVVDWYAFPDLTKREGIYKVGFIFETYKEDTEYIWYVDTNTNRISAGNSGAKAILDTLDTFD